MSPDLLMLRMTRMSAFTSSAQHHSLPAPLIDFYRILMLIDAIASDAVLDEAYVWLCHRAAFYRAAKAHPYELTGKEQAVLAMLANGKCNALIADELSWSRRTVENHVSSILSKLSCKNRLEVVLRTQSEPWILPES